MATTYAWFIKNKYIYIISPEGKTASQAAESAIIRDEPYSGTDLENLKNNVSLKFKTGDYNTDFVAYSNAFNEMKDKMSRYQSNYFMDSDLLSASDYFDIQNNDCSFLKGAKGEKGDVTVPIFDITLKTVPFGMPAKATSGKITYDSLNYPHYDMLFEIPEGKPGTISDSFGSTIVTKTEFDKKIAEIDGKVTATNNRISPIETNIGKKSELSNYDDAEVTADNKNLYYLVNYNKGKIDSLNTQLLNKADNKWTKNTSRTDFYGVAMRKEQDLSNGILYSSNVTVSASAVRAADGFYETSDERLKNFQEDVDPSFLNEIPTKYFSWKSDKNAERHMGTSAQELQKHYPEIVTEDQNGELSVDYAKLSVLAISAIKELTKKVEKLEEEVRELKK